MSDDEVFDTTQLEDNDELLTLTIDRDPDPPQDEKTPEDEHLKERSDCIVDITHSVFFHTGRAFRSKPSDFRELVNYICPSFLSFTGSPETLHFYSHRERHPSVCIERIVKQYTIAISDISKIYATMNGLIHHISQSKTTRDFVAFSFCLERILQRQETDRSKFQWFEEILNEKRSIMHRMEDRGTLAYSKVFEEILTSSEETWFDMKLSGGGMEVVGLNDDEGFRNRHLKYDKMDRHEIATKISNLCYERNYMALFVWKFDFDGVTRVYLNWKGFRLNLNCTDDVHAIVKTIFQHNIERRDEFVTDDVVVEPLSDEARRIALKVQDDEPCSRRWFKER